MKGKRFERFARLYLLPALGEFDVKRNLIYHVPVGVVLRAFVFDSSGFSPDTFNPTAFVQPLYVPSAHITMTLGERFTGNWNLLVGQEQQLGAELLREMKARSGLLRDLGSPEQLARCGGTRFSDKNHYVRQAVAYSLIVIGDYRSAFDALQNLSAMLQQMIPSQPWAAAVREEVRELTEILVRCPEQAQQVVASWAEQTRQTLSLPQ